MVWSFWWALLLAERRDKKQKTTLSDLDVKHHVKLGEAIYSREKDGGVARL